MLLEYFKTVLAHVFAAIREHMSPSLGSRFIGVSLLICPVMSDHQVTSVVTSTDHYFDGGVLQMFPPFLAFSSSHNYL